MVISIDLDGTAWRHREFFREFVRAMKNEGHTVGILTSHEDTISHADCNLFVARFGVRPDFWIGRYVGETFEDHKEWKIQKARQNGVNYHFDDWATFGEVEMWCGLNCPPERP